MDGFIDKLLSGVRNRDGRSLKDALGDGPSENARKLNGLIRDELNRAPRVAVLGKTGVGKSFTINAIFGTSLATSHTKSCTQFEQEIALKKSSRNLILFDMPGLLEDIDTDERHKATYARIIPQCDVAIWVLDAADRAIAADQLMIRDVVRPASQEVVNRPLLG